MNSLRSLLLVCVGLALASCSAAVGDADGSTGGQPLSCPGSYALTYCNSGIITMDCCPVGAHCAPVPGFCDLGGGACSSGSACPHDGGSD